MSRKAEWLAWLSSIGLFMGLIIASAGSDTISILLWGFAYFLIFSAGSISLGNWMDYRTVLRLDADGVAYQNGLRSVSFKWDEVQNVAIVPTKLGKRVQVQGAQSHFTFKTMGELKMGNQWLRAGFADGEEILARILEKCRMIVKAEKDGIVYYARA
jgi:hypothetical protein